MKHVALYIAEADELVCNGNKPDYCVTNFSVQSPDTTCENTFYLEENFLNHIVNHYTLEQLDILIPEYYYRLNEIYESADRLFNKKNINKAQGKYDLTYARPNISFGKTKVLPLPIVNREHRYEYDVHAAYAAMLMFRYYLSDKDEGHEGDGHYTFKTAGSYRTVVVCENPLKDVHSVYVSDNHLVYSEKNTNKKYLCSRPVGYREEYAIVLMTAQDLIRDCWRALKIDCSHFVYALIISQVFKSMHSATKIATLRAFDALLQLSSSKIWNEDVTKYLGYYSDAVFCKKAYSKTPVPDRLPGRRYYKRVNNLKAQIHNPVVSSIQTTQDFQKVDSYGRGWASFDRKHLCNYDLDNYDMYHIDMKSAYPSRFYAETGEQIAKNCFGIIKCFDSRLYQKIRLQVSMCSLEIFRRIGKENVIYWKTDGGICLVKKGTNPDLLLGDICQLRIDKIICSKPVVLPEWIKIPEHLHKYSRAYMYDVQTDTNDELYWANLYESCIEEILDYNGIKYPDKYTKRELTSIIDNAERNHDG